MTSPLELIIDENPLELVIEEEQLVIEMGSDVVELLTVSEQGPPGEDGTLTFSQPTQPTSGMKEGDFWFDTNTTNLYIYVDGEWKFQGVDDGFF